MKTPTELHEYLDVHFAAVIDKAVSLTIHMDPKVRAGSIAGFLIKTGVGVAVRGGCPKGTLLAAFTLAIDELYGS